eukprot:342273-Chlamydomonas_euryale.AAC.7
MAAISFSSSLKPPPPGATPGLRPAEKSAAASPRTSEMRLCASLWLSGFAPAAEAAACARVESGRCARVARSVVVVECRAQGRKHADAREMAARFLSTSRMQLLAAVIGIPVRTAAAAGRTWPASGEVLHPATLYRKASAMMVLWVLDGALPDANHILDAISVH